MYNFISRVIGEKEFLSKYFSFPRSYKYLVNISIKPWIFSDTVYMSRHDLSIRMYVQIHEYAVKIIKSAEVKSMNTRTLRK